MSDLSAAAPLAYEPTRATAWMSIFEAAHRFTVLMKSLIFSLVGKSGSPDKTLAIFATRAKNTAVGAIHAGPALRGIVPTAASFRLTA
jgi:hypothetical protein